MITHHQIGVLFDPRFWSRVGKVNHHWSDRLEDLLDKAETDDIFPVEFEYMTIKLGNYDVWIGTSGYFSLGEYYSLEKNHTDMMPRRRTAIRLQKFIDKLRQKQAKEDIDARA